MPTFTISNLVLLKLRPPQYNIKFGKTIVIIDVFMRLLFKTLWKNFFKYAFLKVMHCHLLYCLVKVIYCIANFHDLKLSGTKWRPFQYNVKYQTKTSFIIVLTRHLSKSLRTKFCFSIYNLGIHFRVSSILSTFTITNVLLLKWRPSQYSIKIGRNPFWLLFSLVFCEKFYEKTIIF